MRKKLFLLPSSLLQQHAEWKRKILAWWFHFTAQNIHSSILCKTLWMRETSSTSFITSSGLRRRWKGMIKRERKPKRKREKILKPFWHFVQVREQSKHEHQTGAPILDHLHYVLLGNKRKTKRFKEMKPFWFCIFLIKMLWFIILNGWIQFFFF